MPLIDFLRRFIAHTAWALAMLYFALLVLEKSIPGFVSPLADLAQIGLATLVLAGLAACLPWRTAGRWRDIFSAGVYFAVCGVLVFFLVTRLADHGWRGYGLLAAAVVLGLAGQRAFWRDKLAD